MGFTNIVARLPSLKCAKGLTTSSLGSPDAELTRSQFFDYIKVLSEIGLDINLLPPLDEFPDSHFVEDTAVVMQEIAVITRPGAEERAGEISSMKNTLKKFRNIIEMQGPGTLEGGDVMQVGKHFYIGLTKRTNEEGIKEFSNIVRPYGYTVIPVEVDEGLHLKSAVNYIGDNSILTTKKFASLSQFKEFNHVIIPDDEIYAGNTLLVNGFFITPQGYNETRNKLIKTGRKVFEINTSEIRRMDGGLTCLSLRF